MEFKLVDGPHFFPGHTLVHRTAGDNHPVVDTGVDLYGEHRVYLSYSESMLIARLWGCLPADEAEELREKVATLETEIAALRRVVDLCKPILDSAEAAGEALAATELVA